VGQHSTGVDRAINALAVYALAQGDAGFLWPLAHRLPVLLSLRLPSRFLIIFVLLVAMMAAWGAQTLCEYRPRYGSLIAIVLVGLCTFTTNRIGPPRLSDVINNGWAPGSPAREFTQISHSPGNSSMIIPALENPGVTLIEIKYTSVAALLGTLVTFSTVLLAAAMWIPAPSAYRRLRPQAEA
jgi:hypothetical protein